MSYRGFGQMLSLLRQGISVEREFGSHSLEALLSIAELIEQSVYERGSLTATANGLTFRLNNPPLRVGAFSSLRLTIDGEPVRPEHVRVRVGLGGPWRELTDIGADRPLQLAPGDRTDVAIDRAPSSGSMDLTVRLELQSIAIPPLVWFEFTDVLARETRR